MDGVPADADGVPADADGVPADADDVPADADGIPADADGVPADADGIPADADGVGGCTKKTYPIYVHYQIFRISLFVGFRLPVALAVLQSEIQYGWRRWRLACTHAHINAINPAFKAR